MTNAAQNVDKTFVFVLVSMTSQKFVMLVGVPCMCDNSVTCANEMPEQSVGDALADLVKLSGGPVTESTLMEITNLKTPVLDALHRLGALMIDKAEKAEMHGAKENDPRMIELNHMSRVGEMLTDLGEPFATPIDRFSKEDLEFVAKKLNLPFEKFSKIIGIREGVEMTPYQSADDMEPMSKKQAMGDQPLVNNTADNSMIDAHHPVKKYAVKTIKEERKLIKQTTLPSGNVR